MNPRTRLPGTPEPMHLWKGADGIRLAGDSWGDPHHPLVVLLHGVGQTRHAWRRTGALLGESGYYAVAFDARGHGDSDWSLDGDYGRDTMVRDIQCVIQALGGRSPVLAGASMGGATSLIAVGEGHVRARGLVLVDIAPRIESDGVARVNAFMEAKPDGFDSLDEVADAVSRYRPTRQRPSNLDGLARNLRLGPDGKLHWHWDPRLSARPRDAIERRLAAARRLTLPTLLVRGAYSDVVSEEGVREFLTLCPHGQYVNVEGAGHMVAGDRNDVFGRAVVDFIRDTERSRPLCV